MRHGDGPRWPASLAVSFGLALLALVLVEGALRLLAPEPPSRLPYQRLVLPALARTEAGWVTTDPRMAVQVLREEATPRIVVVGGSAAAGLGFSPNAAFPRHLERFLRAGGKDASVANLGLVAASSREVRRLVADVLAATTPDRIIVYSGNNELLEPLSVRYAREAAGPLDRTRLRAADTRLFGLWRGLLVEEGPPVGLSRVSAAEMSRAVTLPPRVERAALAAYARNLRAIVRDSAVPVVLVTVATDRDVPGATVSRASPEMAEVVRRVAAEEGADLCDLAVREDLQGNGSFYDHIHFTPEGAARVGVALAACLGEPGDVAAYLDQHGHLPERDARAMGDWLGFDPATAHDADLWKYDALVAGLDARLAADPADVEALVYRGNAWAFTPGGAGQARSLWERALQLEEDADVRANLAWLGGG